MGILNGLFGLAPRDGAVMFGPGAEPGFVDTKLAPGTSDQKDSLSVKETWVSIFTLKYYVYSPQAVWILIAVLFHVYAPYDFSAQLFDAPGQWLKSRMALNYSVALAYTTFLHGCMYWTTNWVKRKFSPGTWPTKGNMLHNLFYWSCGIAAWTCWEYVMCRLWASGKIPYATNADIFSDYKLLAWNILFVCITPVMRDLHFYITHRGIHVRAIYRFVHSVHHRNTDVEPFSGLTMHPIEHLFYYSSAFLPSLLLPGLSPLIFLYNMSHAALSPAAGHGGFEDQWQSDQYHFIHHAKFECNYGSPDSGWIDQMFGTFREKLGESKVYTGAATDSETLKANGLSSTEAEKKKSKKVWSGKSYLGQSDTVWDAIYTTFWVSLWAFYVWAAALNHKQDGGLVVAEIAGIPVDVFAASLVAYGPVVLALLLCKMSGDKRSWRWPFQKDPFLGAFGLFLILFWATSVLPVYYATKLVSGTETQ